MARVRTKVTAAVSRRRAKALRSILESLVVDAVCGMDADDCIGTVKIHFADGSTRWLVDVIEELNTLRAEDSRP